MNLSYADVLTIAKIQPESIRNVRILGDDLKSKDTIDNMRTDAYVEIYKLLLYRERETAISQSSSRHRKPQIYSNNV